MDLESSLITSASGMKAQSARMRIVAENIANEKTTPSSAKEDPYKRKTIAFREVMDRSTGARVVEVAKIARDDAPFRSVYDPGNKAANANGQVALPNVNLSVEMADMMEAQSAFEANMTAAEASRAMLLKTLDLMR